LSAGFEVMISDKNVQVSDTTGDDSSNDDGFIKYSMSNVQFSMLNFKPQTINYKLITGVYGFDSIDL
jgi:hypothetical protein